MPQDIAGSDSQVDATAYVPLFDVSGSNLEPNLARRLAEYDDSGKALFNDNVVRGADDGVVLLKKERPDHRIMVMLKAQGKSTAEIAQFLDVTPTTVNYVLRQPWARQMLISLIHASGEQGIDAFLQSELLPSMMKLVEVRDDPVAKKSEQLAAANSLIDRFLGKPMQRVETAKAPDPVDLAQLQKESERLELELKRVQGN